MDTRCDICHYRSENTSHILWECPFAQNVWALMSSRIQKCRNMANDFFQLFRQVRDRLTQRELEQWQLLRGRFGMQETGSTLSMSNSNQKQSLMLLADYWKSTNASWLCSKNPLFFFSVFLLHICIGLVLQCCISFYF